MHTILRRLRYSCLLFPALLIILFANTGTTMAAGTPVLVSLLLTGGTLTEVPGAVAIGTNLIVGTTVTYSIPIVVTDATGSGLGWNMTITSTPFTNGTQTFPTNASTINTAPSVTCPPIVCVAPNNTITYPPLPVPAGVGPPTAVKFFNAAGGTGTGVMTITPTISVAVPATALTILPYTSTVTLNIVSGP